jgi:hypothetical protein
MDDKQLIPPENDMSFEAAEWAMLKQGLTLTPDEKLDKLEEMHRFAKSVEQARESQGIYQPKLNSNT